MICTASSSQSGCGPAGDLDVDAVRIAGLGEQRLGLGDVALHEGQLGVFRVHLRDVVVLAGLAEPAVRALEHRFGVGRVAQSLAHPLVVERLDRMRARDRGVGGVDRVDLHVRQLLDRRQGRDRALVDHVDLLRGQRRDLRRRIVAEIDDLEALEPRALAPVTALARDVDRALADLVLDQLVGAGAVAADPELAALGGVEDQQRVVVERLGDRQVGLLAVELDVKSSTFWIALASHSRSTSSGCRWRPSPRSRTARG
jgi:hypothetical protein